MEFYYLIPNSSTLALLMTRVRTNDANDPIAPNDLALPAHALYGCGYLHGYPPIAVFVVATTWRGKLFCLLSNRKESIERSPYLLEES